MPSGQPFTALCQLLGRPSHAERADLHLHTTASDGTYTPEQIVEFAVRCGLRAVAITDHDTTAGVAPARAVAPPHLEVIAGSEISCSFRGRELHLLAYFFDPEETALADALLWVRQRRAERFQGMLEGLRQRGVTVLAGADPHAAGPESLGRRYLAELLVHQGAVATVREAFARYLGERGGVATPKELLPVERAIALVRQAGGVAAWAHPAYDCTREALADLARQGLGAVEVEYPETRRSRAAELRGWAVGLGLAVSGGSDCHGPGPRAVGACTVSTAELEALRHKRG